MNRLWHRGSLEVQRSLSVLKSVSSDGESLRSRGPEADVCFLAGSATVGCSYAGLRLSLEIGSPDMHELDPSRGKIFATPIRTEYIALNPEDQNPIADELQSVVSRSGLGCR